VAALEPTRLQDGPPRPSRHAVAEPVVLGPLPVVRLVRSLHPWPPRRLRRSRVGEQPGLGNRARQRATRLKDLSHRPRTGATVPRPLVGTGRRPPSPGRLRGRTRITEGGVSTGVDQVVDTSVVGEAELLVTNAERLWILCSQALRTQVTEATWRAWFDGVAPISSDDRTLVLAVPSSLAKERIEARYLPLVRDLLRDAAGLELDVELEIQPGVPAPEDSGGLLSQPGWEEQTAPPAASAPAPPPPPPPRGGGAPPAPSAARSRRRPPEPPLHLRGLRHRRVEPLRPRRRVERGRDAGKVV
jgi:hypothetical protein